MHSSNQPISQMATEIQMAQNNPSVGSKVRQLLSKCGQCAALAVVSFASALVVSGDLVAATDPAASFVQKAATEAIAVLSNSSLPDQDKRSAFRNVILKNFDTPAIARLVVEPFWVKATSNQQTQFQAVFQGALANIYTERFFDYDGQSLQIKGTHQGPDGGTVVQTTIATPTGSKTYDVDWIVSGPPGKEKFLDVVIDGISTSITTQQDYGSVLRSSNGNLDALTAALKAKGQ
jgi:phospholipid transport system substrate-binding protein